MNYKPSTHSMSVDADITDIAGPMKGVKCPACLGTGISFFHAAYGRKRPCNRCKGTGVDIEGDVVEQPK